MSGLSHIMSIAKEALLTHQLAVQVTSHNVANVDTPGFTRQSLEVAANPAVPSGVGSIGSGVRGDSILRHYDQFMTQRIFDQNSTLGNLGAQKDTMRIVEAVFNEASGTGLNNVMSMFWDSWQELVNSPDIQATRQSLVQVGQVMSDQLGFMSSEVSKIKYDIGVSLGVALEDTNSITRQIAELNHQIASSEVGNRKANDLRDQRDNLVQELSEFVDITYLESSSGTYTIMLPDGHPLVDKGDSWELDWNDNNLSWESINSLGDRTSATIGNGAEVGGKIGGWLEVRGQLVENDPDNYLGRLNALANALIREVNQQFSQGVGKVPFSGEVLGKSDLARVAYLSSTVDPADATHDIEAGIIKINGREVDKIVGAVAVNGLAMGKAANAVERINEALTGVTARLTTLVAGTPVVPVPANDGDIISFDLNGVNVSYTVDNDGLAPLPDDNDQTAFATNMVNAVNTAIAAHNADPTNPTKLTIAAAVGDGTNGGAVNSIVLTNTNAGDESEIVIANLSSNPPSGIEANLGLTAGTYRADADHNTGEISLFSRKPFEVEAGSDDRNLNELGLGGGLHVDDVPGDGRFYFSVNNGTIPLSLQGYDYIDELVTDGGVMEVWLYNPDGSTALPQPVKIPLDRVYTLQDVADSINVSITNATGGAAWLTASVFQDRLLLTPDSTHQFAFGSDSSNLLQVAGVNTFFTGHDAATLGVNEDVAEDLDLIAAATVNQFGEIFQGDNTNALAVSKIQRSEEIHFTGGVTGTLDGFYNSLVGTIGMEGRAANADFEFNTMLADQLNAMRDSVSGVSLDEEMANLIKFQQAYTAAAKIITVADEMMDNLVNTVRR